MKKGFFFFQQRLDAEDISKEIVSETLLVVEALFHNLLEQKIGRKTRIRLSCRNSLGTIMIQIGFEGKLAYLYSPDDGVFSPEDQILAAYEDKIDHSYHAGFNSFQINVRRKHLRSLLYCVIGILFAFLVFIPINYLLPTTAKIRMVSIYLYPIERLIGNAALMIGAPVTFFSLLKNLMDTYILSNRYSEVRKLRIKALATAVITVLLAVGMGFLLLSRFKVMEAVTEQKPAAGAGEAFAKLISEAIPSSIFEPFETVSPIPLIVLSLVATIALSSAGRYFVKLKEAVDIGYAVFSRMLGLVLFVFPFFFFVSFLDLLLLGSMDNLWEMMQAIFLILAGTCILPVFYLIRLKIGGVRLRPFLQKLPPLLLENCKINSSLDAVPFNIRYCVRYYGMSRKRLERSLPALAQIMFDGNCFLLMILAIYFSFGLGLSHTWYDLTILAILVIFLSFGAPNQPGSILIGTIIILKYMGYDASEYMSIPIIFEAVFGIVQNLVNVIGDIVTVTIEEQKQNKKEHLPEPVS